MKKRLSLLAGCASLGIFSCSSAPSEAPDAGPPPSVTGSAAPSQPPPPGPVEPPVEAGVWKSVALPTANVTAVYSPRAGLTFLGGPDGMFRFDGKEIQKVDLGCTCSISDIDRDTGLAIGREGENIYAATFANDAWKPIPWKTGRRISGEPLRVTGNSENFTFLVKDGRFPISYRSQTTFGPRLESDEAFGSDYDQPGVAHAVWGTPAKYWIAADMGRYSRDDARAKPYLREDTVRFVDIWATGALEYAYSAPKAFVHKLASGVWTRDITIPMPAPDDWGPREAYRIWAQGNAYWILTANKFGEGAKLGYLANRDASMTWVDFPRRTVFAAATFSASEAWLVGTEAYRCVQPGCELPTSAPKTQN